MQSSNHQNLSIEEAGPTAYEEPFQAPHTPSLGLHNGPDDPEEFFRIPPLSPESNCDGLPLRIPRLIRSHGIDNFFEYNELESLRLSEVEYYRYSEDGEREIYVGCESTHNVRPISEYQYNIDYLGFSEIHPELLAAPVQGLTPPLPAPEEDTG